MVATLSRSAVGQTNLPAGAVRNYAALFEENGDGTYTFDVFVPAYARIVDLGATAIALWTAGTSASLDVGDYEADTDEDTGIITLGSEIDLNGFFVDVDLKATDLIAGQSISLAGGGQGEVAGAYNSGTNTHWDDLVVAVDRFVQFRIVAAGTEALLGRTYVWADIAYPLLNTISIETD
jgi:hypothetical protein